MNRQRNIANAVLWATVIIAAAVVGAPRFFVIGLLPALASVSLLLMRPARTGCMQA